MSANAMRVNPTGGFPTSKIIWTVVGWLVVFVFFFPVLWMWLEAFKTEPQAASIPTITANKTDRIRMLLIVLEALGALVVLLLIVWWTMFSGRKGGEPPRDEDQ